MWTLGFFHLVLRERIIYLHNKTYRKGVYWCITSQVRTQRETVTLFTKAKFCKIKVHVLHTKLGIVQSILSRFVMSKLLFHILKREFSDLQILRYFKEPTIRRKYYWGLFCYSSLYPDSREKKWHRKLKKRKRKKQWWWFE